MRSAEEAQQEARINALHAAVKTLANTHRSSSERHVLEIARKYEQYIRTGEVERR